MVQAMCKKSAFPSGGSPGLIFLALSFGATLCTGQPDPQSPRQLYNEGTLYFNQGKLREAETSLESAVASQNRKVQPTALYNLGHVRFQQGAVELKKGPGAKPTSARANSAIDSGDAAIQRIDQAMADADLHAMVAAYRRGRGARKELKAAAEAVKKALESYGAVLAKWRRASGDFKSADELRADAQARANAEVVDRAIAQLVDSQQIVIQGQQGVGDKQKELAAKMGKLKGQLPAEIQAQLGKGDEEDEEDEGKDKPGPEPKPGDKEPESKEGREQLMSREEASRLLDMLRLDGNRKLPLGMKETSNQKDPKRREW